MIRAAMTLLLVCALAAPAVAQGAGTKPPERHTRTRIAWTLGGIGIGFGAGTYVGFKKFDQATYAERKIWTTAITCAAAGGVIAFLLTRGRDKDKK